MKKVLSAFVIALLLGAYILVYEKDKPSTDELKEREKRVFDFTSSSDITKIELLKDGKTIICRKADASGWELLEPIKAKADEAALESILSRIRFLEFQRRLDGKGLSLEGYGLEPPKICVSLWEGDKKTAFQMGKNTSIGDNVYMKLKDEEDILVVGKSLYESLDKDVNELRSRAIISLDKEKAERLELYHGRYAVKCTKEGEEWRIIFPISDRAEPEELKGLFDKLERLRVENFVSDTSQPNLSEYGLDKPAVTVKIKQAEAETALLFGKVTDDGKEVYVKKDVSDFIYTVKEKETAAFRQTHNELRDRKVLRFDIAQVKSITLIYSEKTTILQKEGDAWKMLGPASTRTDTTEVDNLLYELEELDVEEFVSEKADDLAAFGLSAPLAGVSLTFLDGTTQKFFLGNNTPKTSCCYAMRENESVVFTIRGDFLDAVLDFV